MTFKDLQKIQRILKDTEESIGRDIKRMRKELESLGSVEAPTDETEECRAQLYIEIDEAARKRSDVSRLIMAVDDMTMT